MTEQSIRRLLADLEAADRLARVTVPVDPENELAALGLKAYARLAKGVRLDSIRGMAGWRAATALLVDRAQWSRGLGIAAPDLLSVGRERARSGIDPVVVAAAEAPVGANRISGGGLARLRLPIPRAFARDAAPQTAAVAIALDPETGRHCLSLLRACLLAPGRFGVADLGPAMERLRRREAERGRDLSLALVVGAHPAVHLAAALGTWSIADLPLAGSLAGEPIRVLRLDPSGLPVPADAELVVAGALSATETCEVGPLGSAFGTYAPASTLSVFAAASVLHRAEPIFYAMRIGAAGDHAGTLCLAAEILVAEHIRNIEGGIDLIDIRCPPAAGGLVVVVKLRGRMEGQAKTALMGVLSGAFNWAKLAIAVDEDVDAGDPRDVLWSVASRTHAQDDVGMIDGMRAHPLDHVSPLDGGGAGTGERLGTRWFIDSTMPPLSQGKRREDFARAVPKSLNEVDLAAFLPKL